MAAKACLIVLEIISCRFTFTATTTAVVVVDAGSAILTGRVIIPVVTDFVTAHGSYSTLLDASEQMWIVHAVWVFCVPVSDLDVVSSWRHRHSVLLGVAVVRDASSWILDAGVGVSSRSGRCLRACGSCATNDIVHVLRSGFL